MTPEEYMQESIHLAEKGMRTNSGGPFGAVVVKDGVIIGYGYNKVSSTNDPTAHAEIVAIREACHKTKSFSLEGAVLYTSCEPCPMCLSAIYWARISKVYYANERRDAATIGFDDEWLYTQVSLPIHERSLLMEQIMRKEALVTFDEWCMKMDKIHY